MLFKDGMRSYFVLPKKDYTEKKALAKANEHFKENTKALMIQSGRMIDDETVEIGVKGDQWVVSRKGKR